LTFAPSYTRIRASGRADNVERERETGASGDAPFLADRNCWRIDPASWPETRGNARERKREKILENSGKILPQKTTMFSRRRCSTRAHHSPVSFPFLERVTREDLMQLKSEKSLAYVRATCVKKFCYRPRVVPSRNTE